MLCILLPVFKPTLPQIRLLQVVRILTSDWLKLPGSHAVHWTPVTCCKTKLWATVNRGGIQDFFKEGVVGNVPGPREWERREGGNGGGWGRLG